MDTPIYDFLIQYAAKKPARFHMPGHKGSPRFPFSCAELDITEIAGADSLYEAHGVIRRSEENAARLFGSRQTVYSASGSTLCIQTMLLLTCKPGDRIICARNAHSAFYHVLALLNLHPVWLFPVCRDEGGVSGEILPEQLEAALSRHPDAAAVYLTSPDYLGGSSDIAALAALCRRAGVPLLVDNAHGAHLKFLPGRTGFPDRHPITLGASLCCDSAHKTLPALTGGAYLHSNLPCSAGELKSAMSRIGTTSPSYLILASLDWCNRYLEEEAATDFARLSHRHRRLEAAAKAAGYLLPIPDCDPTKLTLSGTELGYTGPQLAAYLREEGIEPEYVGPDHLVFLMTPFQPEENFARLEAALNELPRRSPLPRPQAVAWEPPPAPMAPAQAVFAPQETVPVEDAAGRICVETKITCPPGVPVVCPGEKITPQAQKLFRNSGIRFVKVVK